MENRVQVSYAWKIQVPPPTFSELIFGDLEIALRLLVVPGSHHGISFDFA